MTNELKIQRLQDTIDKLKTLKPEQFNYNSYVREFNKELKCGTVCCAAGWYPKWFPEAGLIWAEDKKEFTTIYLRPLNGDTSKGKTLALWHGLDMKTIYALFFGDPHKGLGMEELTEEEVITIEMVIERFEKVVKGLESEIIVLE